MRIANDIFSWILFAFLVLLPLQFAFAGYGIFSGKYDAHEAFGAGLLHGLVLVALIAALFARRWKLAGLTFVLFLLFFVQISLVSIGRDNDAAWVSGLHPFIAFCYWPYVYFLLWLPSRTNMPAADTAAIPQA